MDELLSRFPDLAEDMFENLDDERLINCKEACRSMFKSYVFFLFEFMNPQTTHTYMYIKMYTL